MRDKRKKSTDEGYSYFVVERYVARDRGEDKKSKNLRA